jgi:hypothetical protein
MFIWYLCVCVCVCVCVFFALDWLGFTLKVTDHLRQMVMKSNQRPTKRGSGEKKALVCILYTLALTR